MLLLADIFFTALHLAIIVFNLFGWMFKKTRKAHFFTILLTAGSWFILGIWFGIGYCPITDWQWQVKQKLGERNLPNSFIKYYGDKITGYTLDTAFIDVITLLAFILAACGAVYFNVFAGKRVRNKPI
jgi:hypothetical protein